MVRQLTELTDEQLNALAELVSDKVVKKQKAENKRKGSLMYHNTKLLLVNYHQLKKHCEIVNEQVTEQLGSLWSDWRFDLDTLLEHKAKTAKLMIHVDKALKKYQEDCRKAATAEESKRFQILQLRYINQPRMSQFDTAVELRMNRKTIARHEEAAIHTLSVYMYGYEYLEKWT